MRGSARPEFASGSRAWCARLMRWSALICMIAMLPGCSNVLAADADPLPTCVFVASYHSGYGWQEGVERGLRQSLGERCKLVQVNMDTKHRSSESDKRAAARHAWQIIQTRQPDLVITADDNAARYLLVPYLLDAAYPVVFCGINWTVEEYGLPAPNVTGIVEVSPIGPVLQAGRQLSNGGIRAAYVGADNESQRKNLKRFQQIGKTQGVHIDGLLTQRSVSMGNASAHRPDV